MWLSKFTPRLWGRCRSINDTVANVHLTSIIQAACLSSLHHVVLFRRTLFCADDTQLYLSFEPAEYQILIERMEVCIFKMTQWLLSIINRVLNTAKTEILLFSTRQQLTKVSQPVTVCIWR